MATTRIYLVRHGATQLTAEDRFSGTTGDLSEVGRAQIARLGERLRGERIQALYASPLSRALDSARILRAAIGLEPELCDGLREIDYRIKGVHAKVRVLWNFEAPDGAGDAHYSIMRGSKANLLIGIVQQGSQSRTPAGILGTRRQLHRGGPHRPVVIRK